VTFQKNLKELDRSANIYVKNLHSEVTGKDLEEAFSKYGEVFSTKVAQDDQQNSLMYGYVQFKKKEHAELCMQDTEDIILKE
jgi:polyadenylate-binding protein